MGETRSFSREELFDLVWSQPMQRLARDFGISDVGLAKTCKRYNIPRPGRGHWQRIAAGQKVRRPKLPPPPPGSQTITFSIPDPKVVEPDAAEEILRWAEREHAPANKIVVAEVVHNFHPLLSDTKERSAKDAAAIYVDPESWPRARRLWHALAVALEERGFRIGPRDSWDRSTVTILGETVGLSMEERTRRVERTDPTPQRRWLYLGTGKLRYVIEDRGERISIEDRSKLPLEDQLNEVVIALVRMAVEVARPQRVAAEEDVRQRAEQERLRRLFEQRRDRFEAAFRAWKDFDERRMFVEVLEAAVPADSDEATREFVAWTRRYLDASSPVRRLFESLAKNERAQYRQFTTERLW